MIYVLRGCYTFDWKAFLFFLKTVLSIMDIVNIRSTHVAKRKHNWAKLFTTQKTCWTISAIIDLTLCLVSRRTNRNRRNWTHDLFASLSFFIWCKGLISALQYGKVPVVYRHCLPVQNKFTLNCVIWTFMRMVTDQKLFYVILCALMRGTG